jgi:hypothetical protein
MDLDGVTVGEDVRIVSMISKPRTAIVDDFGVKWVYSGVVFQPSEGPIRVQMIWMPMNFLTLMTRRNISV